MASSVEALLSEGRIAVFVGGMTFFRHLAVAYREHQ